jgi:hypothetical protein
VCERFYDVIETYYPLFFFSHPGFHTQGGEKYEVAVDDPTITVEEFKKVLEGVCSLPPDQQRLIYKVCVCVCACVYV